MKTKVRTLIYGLSSLAIITFGSMGSAQADSFTSVPIIHNFPGPYSTTTSLDGDHTWTVFTDQSGWTNFGATANPIPALLASIDPNFDNLYQIDSITIGSYQMWTTTSYLPSSEQWYWDIGSGQTPNGVLASFLLGSATYQSFTLSGTENSDAFNLALAGDTGVFQFKYRETTTMADTFWAFKTSAVVNYSDKPAPDPVPEPATMLLFGTGLVGLAATRLRKKK